MGSNVRSPFLLETLMTCTLTESAGVAELVAGADEAEAASGVTSELP